MSTGCPLSAGRHARLLLWDLQFNWSRHAQHFELLTLRAVRGRCVMMHAPMQELSQVDLVFCIDLTNSMSPFLMRAKQHLVRAPALFLCFSLCVFAFVSHIGRYIFSTRLLASHRQTLPLPLLATQTTAACLPSIPWWCTISATRCRLLPQLSTL